MRILVLGYIIRFPLGGMAWHYLQYVMGLRALGHDVFFLEDSEDYPCCYDPTRNVTDTCPDYGLLFATRTFDELGLGHRWAYFDAHTHSWYGPRAGDVLELAGTADLLLNISGSNPLRPWLMEIPTRVFVDTDPGFEQLRHIADTARRERADMHTEFFTFGENIESGIANVPADGRFWKATRQPVVLDAWKVTGGDPAAPFTTVMQYKAYATRRFAGLPRSGQRSESFSALMDLPSLVPSTLELAIGSPSAPRETLSEKGWRVRDPLSVTRDPWTYQAYIQRSKAEFGVAKGQSSCRIPGSQSGWRLTGASLLSTRLRRRRRRSRR
jgi:hypothetical protein